VIASAYIVSNCHETDIEWRKVEFNKNIVY
jgi:hypothetical protein